MKTKGAILHQLIAILLAASFFLVPSKTLADTQCGDGGTCTGTNTYWRIRDCTNGTTHCLNDDTTDQQYYPHTCSTNGGSGTCYSYAPGKNGCNMYTIPGGSGNCSAGGLACTNVGGNCGPSAPYTGTCLGTQGDCSTLSPQGGDLSCCNYPPNPQPTPTPTPSNPPNTPQPPGYCGDLLCLAPETCSSCGQDCGTCGSCGWCGNGICEQGTAVCRQETDCNCPVDCGNTCNSNNSCSVTLSPTTAGLTVGGSSTTLTASVTSTGGSVSRVNFTNSNGGVASVLSPSDATTPYQTVISPISTGTAIITASCEMNLTPGTYMAGSATSTIEVTGPPIPDPGDPMPTIPICEGFSIPQGTYDISAGTIPITVDSFYEGANYGYIIGDGNHSFELANTNGWIQHNLGAFWTPDSLLNGPPADGRYYFAMARAAAGDSYAASNFIDVGENINGRSFTLKFMAKAHSSTANTVNMQIQAYPSGGDWTNPPSTLYTTPITLSASEWQEFEHTFSLTNYPGYNESQIRVILRPPSNGTTWPVYYDNVRLYKNWTTDVANVRFFYTSQQGNYCAPTPAWQPANNASNSNYLYSANGTHGWDISGLSAGNYMVTANIYGEDGEWCSGNPSVAMCYPSNNCSTCSIPVQITSCPTGTPGTPTNLTPSGAYNMTNTANQITLGWGAPTTGASYVDEYDVIVWDTGDFANPTAAWAVRTTSADVMFYDTVTFSTLNRTISNVQNEYATGRDLSFSVRARNTSCGTQDGNWATATNFSLIANLTGSIYLGDGSYSIVGGICSNGGSAVIPAPGVTAVVTGTVSGGFTPITANVNFNGAAFAYTITGAAYTPTSNWGTVTVSSTFTNSEITNTAACACPAPGADPFTCQYTGLTNPRTGVTFYAEQYDLSNGPWWQGVGGLIYATNNGVVSNITDQCVADGTGICTPYITIRDVTNANKTAGITIAASGTISSGSSNAGYYRESDVGATPPSTNYKAEGADFSRALRQDYTYFARNFDLAGMTKIASATINTKTQLTVGFTDTNDGTQVSYREGSLTIDPNVASTISIATGERRIIFVRDDLTISNTNNLDELIKVEQGGYVAFIVGGNITISETVGFLDPTTPVSDVTNIEGVYVADGSISVASHVSPAIQNRKFIGAGTFVGWSGIALTRDYANTSNALSAALNNLNPISVFVYRPDFVETTPELLMAPGLIWQEVN